MNPNELLLPPASRLVHIGPHKTGTTSLQQAFHKGRKALEPHRVHYAGRTEQPLLAALAVAGGGGMKGDRPPRPEDWTDLVDEVRAAGDDRVLVSSEFLCYADDMAAKRVVTEIAGGPVHVVVTLRPIAKIAPSQWQQYVQNGLRVPYLDWLEGMFRRPPYDQPTPSFWRRHSHGELVRRWAQAVGPENLTVVVADESEPDMLLRTFEAFLGLPQGLMVSPKNSTNRSLSRGEIELVLETNKFFAKHKWSDPWSEDLHARAIRHGVVRRMKTGRVPAPGEPRLVMPAWAAERAAEIGGQTVETITSLGVRVVGDLAPLAEVPADRRGDEADLKRPALIPAEAARLAVLGAINAEGERHKGAETAAALAVIGAINATADAGKERRVEPALSVLYAVSNTPGKIDLSEAPPVRSDAAARAALGVIEAKLERASRAGSVTVDEQTDTDKPTQMPVEAAWLAAVGATKASRAVGREAKKVVKPAGKATAPAPTQKPSVEKVSGNELLREVARRANKRLRRRFRRP